MATKELDRWLLNRGPYPDLSYDKETHPQTVGVWRVVPREPTLTEQGRQAFKDAATETVQPANTSKSTTVSMTIKSVQFTHCMHFGCYKRSERIGAQDFCDVYKCPDGHINRYEVGKGVRSEWTEDWHD